LKKMKEDLDKQRTILKGDVIAQREKDLQEKFVQLQGTYVRLQKDLSEKEAEMMKGIMGKMQGVIAQIAAQESFTIVFEKTESSILWAKPSLDLTNEVIRRYNAGAAKGATPPPKKYRDRGHPRDPGLAAPPLSVPARRSRRRADGRQDRRTQERHRERASLSGTLPGPSHHAGCAHHRGDGTVGR